MTLNNTANLTLLFSTFLVLLTHCSPRKSSEAPLQQTVAPPSYYEDCSASHNFYYDLASDSSHLSDEGAIPPQHQAALEKAKHLISQRGIDIRSKGPGDGAWYGFTTTLPTVILTGEGFEDYPTGVQASILWHELVHVRQYESLGVPGFFKLYVVPEGRWALEVQAYRESYIAQMQLGVPKSYLLGHTHKQAEDLYSGYYLQGMPQTCAVSKATELWEAAILSFPTSDSNK